MPVSCCYVDMALFENIEGIVEEEEVEYLACLFRLRHRVNSPTWKPINIIESAPTMDAKNSFKKLYILTVQKNCIN